MPKLMAGKAHLSSSDILFGSVQESVKSTILYYISVDRRDS